MLNFPLLRPSISVVLGAIPGVLLRYFLLTWFNDPDFGNLYPLGTFLVNISGCFLLGLITHLALEKWSINEEFRLFLTTGFLGSYTTFSSYELDTANILNKNDLFADIFYWIGSPILGIICFNLGAFLGRKLN